MILAYWTQQSQTKETVKVILGDWNFTWLIHFLFRYLERLVRSLVFTYWIIIFLACHNRITFQIEEGTEVVKAVPPPKPSCSSKCSILPVLSLRVPFIAYLSFGSA